MKREDLHPAPQQPLGPALPRKPAQNSPPARAGTGNAPPPALGTPTKPQTGLEWLQQLYRTYNPRSLK